MANNANTFFTIAILVVACCLIYNTSNVSAELEPTPCGGSFIGFITQCSQFVGKTGKVGPPSAGCCAEVRKVDVACACKLVTKETEKLVNVQRAIFVARFCGLNIPPGIQCGSVRVPPKK